MARDPWYYYGRELDDYDKALDQLDYAGIAPKPPEPRRRTEGFFRFLEGGDDASLTPERIKRLLSESDVGPPHGFGLLAPLPLPTFLRFPERPETAPPIQKPELGFSIFGSPWRPPKHEADAGVLQQEKRVREKTANVRNTIEQKYQTAKAHLDALRARCVASDYEAVRLLINLSHVRHQLPYFFRMFWEVEIDQTARIVLCTFELPAFNSLKIYKSGNNSRASKEVEVSSTERKRLLETIVYSLCLRAAYLAAKSDAGNWFDTVAVNVTQKWNDVATGQPREGIIASLQAQKIEIAQLNIHQVDPKACFRHLKGLSTPSTEDVAPIRPIFTLNKDDGRIVKGRDVDQGLGPETNIAAMPWEDFEHLVRQLFEWEFGRSGVEVKVTRASRDRGVDAIMFDPDPLRGGKYVLQAKRYTRPVDVAAVRDLYGTVVNEGANRGILVTTSSYGPDAYDFAKDKPLSLVDGPNLIAMLQKHGRRYRIDLLEARRLAAMETSKGASATR
jgi:restriction system protein